MRTLNVSLLAITLLILCSAQLLISSTALADYRDPKRDVTTEKSKPCDPKTKARILSYVQANAAEFEKMNITTPAPEGIEQCYIRQQFLVDGETFLLAGASLGRAWDIDVQVSVNVTLLLGESKSYRIRDWRFANPSALSIEGKDRELTQIFSETACTRFEDFVKTELFFRNDTPCLRYILNTPFQGTVIQCENQGSEVTNFGLVNGLLPWGQALEAADKVFRDSKFLIRELDEEESYGIWGNPSTTIAIMQVDEGLRYAVLTNGYRDGDQPDLFTVVEPDGTARGISILQRGNYTCDQLQAWANSGVPDEIREQKYSQPPYTVPSTVEIPKITSADYFEYSGSAVSPKSSYSDSIDVQLRFEITEQGRREQGNHSIQVFPAKLLGSAKIEGLGEFRVEGSAYQHSKSAAPDFKLTLISTTQTLQMDLHPHNNSVNGMMKSLAGAEFDAFFQGKEMRKGPTQIYTQSSLP